MSSSFEKNNNNKKKKETELFKTEEEGVAIVYMELSD